MAKRKILQEIRDDREQSPALDDHGQPLNRQYNKKRLNDRMIDELIGLSRGVVADNIIDQREAEFLKSWMENNIAFCGDPIVNQLYGRIEAMLKDGVLDKIEQDELLNLLREFSGDLIHSHPEKLASTLPLCRPAPNIIFFDKKFCLTGKFAYGPRRICQEVITDLGGDTANNITLDLDYLVIGSLCNTDWIHTSYGRKIEKAAQYREKQGNPSIISENYWMDGVNSAG